MIRNELGKIRNVWIGYGGYQDAMFGIGFAIGGDSWGVGDFRGTWAHKPDKTAKWTIADQDRNFAETMRFMLSLCVDAKVTEIAQLNGIPVEVTFDGNSLKSWRILKEVI